MTVAPLRAIPTNGHDVTTPITAIDAEMAVVGAALVSSRVVEPICTETGLRREHFHRQTLGELWEAIVQRVDRGDGIDALILSRDLGDRVPPDRIEQLAAAPPAIGNARQYARLVVDAHRWEQRRQAHWRALEAVARRDEPAVYAAEALASGIVQRGSEHATDPARLGERAAQRLSEPRPAAVPLPWPKLARFLACRAGQTTILAGHTNMGKSVVAQLLAEHAGRKGCHSVIWTNEMGEDELVARTVQRETGVPDKQYLDGEIPADSAGRVLEALRRVPYGAVECAGWSAEEIGRHIRQVKPGLAVLDHFHQLPGSNVREDADRAVIALTTAARQSGCHLVVVSQLNHARDTQATRNAPAMRDLRGTGLLQQLPNNVVFFHRDEEVVRDGRAVAGDSGLLHLAKQRGGRRDIFVNVVFDPGRLTITEEMGA